jgi:hypothetical protein
MESFDKEAADLRVFIERLAFYAGPPKPGVGVPSATKKSIVNERPPAREGSKSRRLVDAAILEITAQGRRLDIGHLLGALLDAGQVIGGKDEKSNLAGYLSRDARVDYVSGQGWGLKGTGAASEPASQQAAPSIAAGGSNETTLDHPGVESFEPLSTFAGAERAPIPAGGE